MHKNKVDIHNGNSFVSDYFCLKQISIYNEITDLYYYEGSLISKSNKYKNFGGLPERTQRKILTAFVDLHSLNFRNFGEGIHPYGTFHHNYYCLPSENKIELYIVDFNTPYAKCKYWDSYVYDAVEEYQCHNLKKSAKLVFENNYII